MIGYVVAALAGAIAMFYLDPDRGAYRRNVTRDRVAGTARQSGATVERAGRRLAADAYGAQQKARHLDADEPPANDAALEQKVMSELFRDRDVPKGRVIVNAVGGVVYLRGEVERPDVIESLEARVRRIPGVVGVENLLHLPGTPARTA